jgi:hypothetical protein
MMIENIDTITFWITTGFTVSILSGLAAWAISLAVRTIIRVMMRG